MSKYPKRSEILVGAHVVIHDHRKHEDDMGVVSEIWTKAESHPHGIKAKLRCGGVGRVKEVLYVCEHKKCFEHEKMGFMTDHVYSRTGKRICRRCGRQEDLIAENFGPQAVALFWK